MGTGCWLGKSNFHFSGFRNLIVKTVIIGALAPRRTFGCWDPVVGPQAGVSSSEQGSMLRCSLENRDAQTRQLQEAVTNVEKHFGELRQIFVAYVRKTAWLRDKVDLLVNEINMYASTETPHLKQGLKNFADEFAKLQDYRQAEAERLEAKVVEPLKAYGTIVKMKWDYLKATLTARNREAKQLTQKEHVREIHLIDMLLYPLNFGLKKNIL